MHTHKVFSQFTIHVAEVHLSMAEEVVLPIEAAHPKILLIVAVTSVALSKGIAENVKISGISFPGTVDPSRFNKAVIVKRAT